MALKPILLLLAAAASAAGSDLAEIDALYLRRHEGKNLETTLERLKAAPPGAARSWRLGRSLIAAAQAKEGREEKLALLKQAEESLREAVRLSPDDAQAHFWLARQMGCANAILRTLGLARSMRKELETALKLDPGHGAAHQVYGELLRELPGLFGGDKKRAVKEIEESIRLTPNDAGHYQPMAEAYLAVSEKGKAVEALRKGLAIQNPDDPASFSADLRDMRELLARLNNSD